MTEPENETDDLDYLRDREDDAAEDAWHDRFFGGDES